MTAVDVRLITWICQSATSAEIADCDAATDPLDGSVWVRLASEPQALEAATALQGFGLAIADREGNRLQVTGWDARLLRRRLGTLLAGVDGLQAEWDATAELVRYHRDRRVEVTGEDPDPSEVLADVERELRNARPLPYRSPSVTDIDSLLQLVDAAEDAYAQLLVQHVEHAAVVLETDTEDRLGI